MSSSLFLEGFLSLRFSYLNLVRKGRVARGCQRWGLPSKPGAPALKQHHPRPGWRGPSPWPWRAGSVGITHIVQLGKQGAQRRGGAPVRPSGLKPTSHSPGDPPGAPRWQRLSSDTQRPGAVLQPQKRLVFFSHLLQNVFIYNSHYSSVDFKWFYIKPPNHISQLIQIIWFFVFVIRSKQVGYIFPPLAFPTHLLWHHLRDAPAAAPAIWGQHCRRPPSVPHLRAWEPPTRGAVPAPGPAPLIPSPFPTWLTHPLCGTSCSLVPAFKCYSPFLLTEPRSHALLLGTQAWWGQGLSLFISASFTMPSTWPIHDLPLPRFQGSATLGKIICFLCFYGWIGW